MNRVSYLNYNWPRDDQEFNSFEPALITASRHGNLSICELLLKNRAKINKADSFSMSALHWAVCLNYSDICDLLLEQKGINVELMDQNNQTPIHLAIRSGNLDLMRVFVDRVSLKSKFRDYLLEAIKSSNVEMVR